MSENKFIARLKGEPTPKSVVEIQNDRLVAPFKSSPMGHIADRDSSVVVAKGAQNWAVNQGQLVPVADDYVGTESDLSGTSRVSGAGLWLNATYTFPATGDETNPVSAIIAPSAKWVLTLCGDSLITQNGSVITLTMLVKIGATHLTTKQFKVRECASQFSRRLAIDFSESEQSVIKAHGGSPLTVQVLCDDEGASATIYSGMTHLTLLQRKIDADLVATDNVLLPEFIENLLEGYIIPADYFSRYDYIEQVEDGGSALPQFTRSGDDMDFSGWLDISSIKNDLDELGDQVAGIEGKIPESASGSNPLVTKQQLATKQDQLTAGDNIIISNNVISATGAGGGAGFDIVVVQELPATGQKGIIYLLAKDGAAPDVYDEYVWITATQTFELIGSTRVDLTDYAKKEELGGYLPLSGGDMSGPITFSGTAYSIKYEVSKYGLVIYTGTGRGFVFSNSGNGVFYPTTDKITDFGRVNNRWRRVYATMLNNGADIAIPTTGGTMALLEDLANIDALPDQTGNAGKVLMTDGERASWQEPAGGTKVIFREWE